MVTNFTVSNLIKDHAISRPHKTAVVFAEQKLTYLELKQKSDLLANYLKNKFVNTEGMLVGIYLDRSLEMIITILAVFKIGAAYIPIDSSYPQDRIGYMVSNSNIGLLLTQEKLLPSLSTINAQIICLDKDWQHETLQDSNLLAIYAEKNVINSLAYVLYTSGSTGKPKGVMINHSSLVNAYFGWQEAYKLRPEDIYLQMANFSFDVFVGDFIRALCSGATLVLCPQEILLNPPMLYQLMLEEKITCAEFVPAVLRTLIDYLDLTTQSLGFMRLLICGSDNWSIGEYKKFKLFCGADTRLINSYGLTEATIDSTYFELTPKNEIFLSNEDSVPIGKPFKNTTIYLLDENLKQVSLGEVGEIYVGGLGLAHGYLNLAELTAARFIECSFGKNDKIRLYKTGDLAKYLPDGNLQFIGRSDDQVKFYGHRIELTEIENNLNQHQAVSQSLVCLQQNAEGSKYLVGYIVFKEKCRLSEKELKQYLKKQLPSYMVPVYFFMVQTLPLTPNGKLDRQLLKKNFKLLSNLNEFSLANPIEQELIKIIAVKFHIDDIKMHHTFLELGISSLSIMHLIGELERLYSIKITIDNIAPYSAVQTLANAIQISLQLNKN